MSIKIIVSRYNEDINWTNDFFNVLIYNKGEPLNHFNEIFLKNVGREGHTYYTYIYENYDYLDDYIIFLQGNPFDHSPNIINKLNEYFVANNNIHVDFNFLSEDIQNTTLKQAQENLWQCKNIYNSYEKIFNKKIDDKELVFGAGAQFIVSKTAILKRSKDFYYNIIQLLNYSNDPPEGHDIERFHKYIFTDE